MLVNGTGVRTRTALRRWLLVEGFLEECQLPAAAIARALQRAREVVAEFDTAVLTVELAPTRAATVIPGESVTRGAALPQPQQSAAPLLQALPAT